MHKIIINTLEFFMVLSIMFLFSSFFCHIIMRKVSLDKLFLSMQKKGRIIANFISSLIGAITPFCVCTTIPIFTGMIQMGISTNIAMSFLFSSPLINISAIILIYLLFGWKFGFYFLFATLIFSTLGGLLVYQLNLDNAINDEIKRKPFGAIDNKKPIHSESLNFSLSLFKNLLIPLIIGAVIAGFIHNYIPLKAIEYFNKLSAWIVIPAMALIGFPIYSNIMVLTPICFSLVNRGMNPGAVMTLMMSGAGISLPTTVVLSRILKRPLFAYYLIYTFFAYCFIGFIFNMLR